MHLSKALKQKYTEEHLSAQEAQRMAEFIAFGPIVFQVARIMSRWGILEMLRSEELTIPEISQRLHRSEYAIKCLMEASLTIGLVLLNEENNRFRISKTGWFLINDPATKVNLNFNQDVNYIGMFYLEDALKNGKPEGLRHFGPWNTVYEGLSQLPKDAQDSWFAFDHFYSDSSFADALRIVFKSKPSTLLDVGGNTGRWAMQCVNYDANIHVTIMDLQQQLELMRKATQGKPGAERINAYPINLADADSRFPTDKHYDAIWMSQFLDCFSESEIESILVKASKIMDDSTTLYIMETLWDRQKYEPAAFCLTQISLYFTAIAKGNSKMYHSEDLFRIIQKAGLEVTNVVDNLGQGHSIITVKKHKL